MHKCDESVLETSFARMINQKKWPKIAKKLAKFVDDERNTQESALKRIKWTVFSEIEPSTVFLNCDNFIVQRSIIAVLEQKRAYLVQ